LQVGWEEKKGDLVFSTTLGDLEKEPGLHKWKKKMSIGRGY